MKEDSNANGLLEQWDGQITLIDDLFPSFVLFFQINNWFSDISLHCPSNTRMRNTKDLGGDRAEHYNTTETWTPSMIGALYESFVPRWSCYVFLSFLVRMLDYIKGISQWNGRIPIYTWKADVSKLVLSMSLLFLLTQPLVDLWQTLYLEKNMSSFKKTFLGLILIHVDFHF